MNRTSILKLAASFFAAVLTINVSAPALHAQTPTQRCVANIPFGFEAGSRHMEPGKYTISLVGEHVMMIKGNSSSAMEYTRWTPDTTPSRNTKIVFHRYGNQYFLRSVWAAGQAEYLESAESSAEAKVRKAQKSAVVARNVTAPNVEVAVLTIPK